MIIKGRPSILNAPSMFNGLNRSVQEIVDEANENFKTTPTYEIMKKAGMSTIIANVDDPMYIELSRREGIMDEYMAIQKEQAKQAEIQRIFVQKEIDKAAEIKRVSDIQSADIEKELEKKRALITNFSNADNDDERKKITAQIRTLDETVIQPKLINSAQTAINNLESSRGNGVFTNAETNKAIADVANYTTSVINYQNVANDYAQGKTTMDVVDKQFKKVDDHFIAVQDSIATMEKDVYKAAAKAGVDLHTGLTTNVVNETVIKPPVGLTDTTFSTVTSLNNSIPAKQTSVLPLIAAAAALYFGTGA
jgi:hypothetical protein